MESNPLNSWVSIQPIPIVPKVGGMCVWFGSTILQSFVWVNECLREEEYFWEEYDEPNDCRGDGGEDYCASGDVFYIFCQLVKLRGGEVDIEFKRSVHTLGHKDEPDR